MSKNTTTPHLGNESLPQIKSQNSIGHFKHHFITSCPLTHVTNGIHNLVKYSIRSWLPLTFDPTTCYLVDYDLSSNLYTRVQYPHHMIVCIYECMCVRTHVFVYVYMHTCMYYVRIYVYMYVCMYVCMYVRKSGKKERKRKHLFILLL